MIRRGYKPNTFLLYYPFLWQLSLPCKCIYNASIAIHVIQLQAIAMISHIYDMNPIFKIRRAGFHEREKELDAAKIFVQNFYLSHTFTATHNNVSSSLQTRIQARNNVIAQKKDMWPMTICSTTKATVQLFIFNVLKV